MVEGATLQERLQQLADRLGNKGLAELAGVTVQAVGKWLKTGEISDVNLRAIAAGSKESYFDLRYGKEWREAAARELGDEFPVDPVSLADAEGVFDTLPPRYREIWVSFGRFMVGRYAPRSPSSPYSKVPPTLDGPRRIKK